MVSLKHYVVIFGIFISLIANSKNTILRVPISEFGPWKIIEKNEFKGIDIQILEEVGKELNLSFEFIGCTFARGLELMKHGQADLMTSLLKRPDREVYIKYIEPPYKTTSSKAFYLRKNEGDGYWMRH